MMIRQVFGDEAAPRIYKHVRGGSGSKTVESRWTTTNEEPCANNENVAAQTSPTARGSRYPGRIHRTLALSCDKFLPKMF